MKTNLHINNQAELERLINRYFDGDTTVQEEEMLRDVLADCPWNSDTIDEALFTMGYFAAHQQRHQQRQRRPVSRVSNRFRYAAIAASLTLLLAVGIGSFWYSQQPKDMCVAYVNGKTVENDDAVMALIANDLNAMDDASLSMEAQLLSIGEALDSDNLYTTQI